MSRINHQPTVYFSALPRFLKSKQTLSEKEINELAKSFEIDGAEDKLTPKLLTIDEPSFDKLCDKLNEETINDFMDPQTKEKHITKAFIIREVARDFDEDHPKRASKLKDVALSNCLNDRWMFGNNPYISDAEFYEGVKKGLY